MKYFIFFLLTLIVLSCNNQKNNLAKIDTDFPFVNNKKIKYRVLLGACDTCALIINVGYRLRVDLTKEEKNKAKEIKYETWEKLLTNPQTDWASNLILYDIYNRDAIIYVDKVYEAGWRKFGKEEDLAYWKKELATQ